MATYEESIVVDTPELFAVIGNQSQTDPVAASQAITQASLVIETVTGVIFEAEVREVPVSKRDAYWLKKATIFQAAWMLEQTDSLTRIGVKSLSQDGLSLSVEHGLDMTLAPMAKRTLANCSWNQNNTMDVTAHTPNGVTSFYIVDSGPFTPMKGF